MSARADAASTAGAMPSPGQCGIAAASLATAVAGIFGGAERAFAAARKRARLAALAWRKHRGDWRTAALQQHLCRAVDLSDLEQRQRAWDRDESNSYSMAGWS